MHAGMTERLQLCLSEEMPQFWDQDAWLCSRIHYLHMHRLGDFGPATLRAAYAWECRAGTGSMADREILLGNYNTA